MQDTLATLYARIVLQRPALVLAVLLAVLVGLALQMQHFKLDASADSLLLENDEDLRIFREVASRYTSQQFLIVTFTPNQALFDDESLRQLKKLRDALAAVERVDSVLSLLDVPLVKNVEGPLTDIVENVRTLESESVDRQRAREELVNSPIFREMLISKDGRTTALRLNLADHPEFVQLRVARDALLSERRIRTLTEEEQQRLAGILDEYDALKTRLDRERHEDIVTVRQILRDFAPNGELHLGGVPMIADDMITYIGNDLVVFGTGVLVFLIAMLWIIFHDLRWVLLPLASCVFAGVVMIGLLGLVGWRVTVISSNFISLMLIITMSMNVHLVVRYRQLARDFPGQTQSELVHGTARKMVWPCLYTALTTIIAFMSLVFSDIKPVIDFGWMMTIGLCVTFATSFLLFPALLVLLGKLPAGAEEPAGSRFMGLLSRLTERHGAVILLSSALLVVVSVAGVYQLRVENSFIDYFSEETEIYQGMKLIDNQLGGTTPLDIVIGFSSDSAGEATDAGAETDTDELEDLEDLLEDDEAADPARHWFTPQKIQLIKDVHDYLDALPETGKVLSLASLIRVAEELNEGKPFSGIELAVLYKRIPDEIKAEMIAPFVSIEADETRINLRILDSRPDLRRNELLQKLHRDLHEKFTLPPERVTITGILVLYNNMLQSLFKSQIQTLGVVMLGVAITLVVLFRSIPLAVIGIVPNLLAAGVILGLMGLLGIPLDMMTITIAAITIGIAVDNSIHYIYRFREEFPRTNDYVATLHYCHANIGRAVFYTAITIIVGFSILVLSNFIPTIYFGIFTALAMAIALLAALTLLPRLIMLWRPF